MDETASVVIHNSLHKPTSILGRLLVNLNKNVLNKIIIWTISASLIVQAFLKLYWDSDSNFIIYNNIMKYEKLYSQLYGLCLGLTLLHLTSHHSFYIKYFNVYQTIVKNGYGSDVTKFLSKKTKTIQSFLKLATICGNNYFNFYLKSGFNSYMIIVSIVSCTFQMLYALFLQFIIECTIYCQSSFIPLNNLLDAFMRQQNNRSTPINIDGVARIIRLHYKKTTKSINCMNTFLTVAICTFYLYFIGHCIFAFGIILSYTSSTNLLSYAITRFLGGTCYLVFTTYHLVRVNQLSVQMFDRVYDFSFSLNSSHSIITMNEINLFLLRVNRNDVGFTFAGLCLVSPSFVSSLATISLSIGLALPSFIK
uniref:Gustatory receptor n=1 Tax=Tetranychus urticae TaxID=32264 RepID=T1KRK0_TETUR